MYFLSTPLPSPTSFLFLLLSERNTFKHTVETVQFDTGPDFARGGPGPTLRMEPSLIIHWSSGSYKRSTNWAHQYDIYFGGAATGGGPGPWPPGPH